MPAGGVATCLRALAPGTLGVFGPLGKRTTSYDVLRLRESGLTLASRFRLPVVFECPAVASHGTRTLLAAADGNRRLRLWIVGGGAAVRGLDIGATGPSTVPLAVDVAADGSAVVAWVQRQGVGFDAPRRSRVVSRLVSRSGRPGPLRVLAGWRRAGDGEPDIAAAMDGAGRATVSWAQPIPDRGRIPNLIPELFEVAVATLEPGRPTAVQRLTREQQGVRALALTVAPDGHALLAHERNDLVQVFDRTEPHARFRPLALYGDFQREELARAPAVAVRDGGGAVVAWRTGGEDKPRAVRLATRATAGVLGAPQTLASADGGHDSGGGFFVSLADGPYPPADENGNDLGVMLDGSGRWLLAWGDERRSALGDAPLAPLAVMGRIGGETGSVRRLGCPCRSVNGVTPFLFDPSKLGLAFADNAGAPLAVGVRAVAKAELEHERGRVHVVDPSIPLPRRAPPRVSVSAAPQRLRHGEPIELRASCDRPCELRAVVPAGGGFRGLGSATLRRAGSTGIEVLPSFVGRLAPVPSAPVPVVVRAWPLAAAGGPARRVLRPRLTLIPPAPVPAPLEARAVRRGAHVVVTWRMRRPARGLHFSVLLEPMRERPPFNLFRELEGEGRRRFRVGFRLARGDDPKRAELTVGATSPPYKQRSTSVPIVRQG